MDHQNSQDSNGDPLRRIRECIAHAAHLLPAQGPIAVFIHHNTLHAFESHSFTDAVVEGARTFGCEPYLSEIQYRAFVSSGRIKPEDLEAVMLDDLDETADDLLGFLGTRFHLRMAMLENPWHEVSTAELKWFLAESDSLRRFLNDESHNHNAMFIKTTRRWVMHELTNKTASGNPRRTAALESVARLAKRVDVNSVGAWPLQEWQTFSMQLLWNVCRAGVVEADSYLPVPNSERRHRDLLFAITQRDSDELVNELLIRFCAAFLDQGISRWPLPGRESGFLTSFLNLYSQERFGVEPWRKSLGAECRRLLERRCSASELIHDELIRLGVTAEAWPEYLSSSLLALRGWAGMIWHIENRGDRAVRPIPGGSLEEFVAVRLLLDRMALEWLAAEVLGFRQPLNALLPFLKKQVVDENKEDADQLAFQIFQIAQYRGWSPGELADVSEQNWQLLLTELRKFSAVERRRIFHLAYERRFRQQTLDAISIHSGNFGAPRQRTTQPRFQVICCIDEREESFRRHLEEIAPQCESFGVAGFFGVAMYYRGAADAHYTPLCPIVIVPQHYVLEHVSESHLGVGDRRRQTRKLIGMAVHRVHLLSRSLWGGLLTALIGAIATLPLVMRVLFPRLTARLRQLFGQFVQTPTVTQLCLERITEKPGFETGQVGYSVGEMTAIVERTLRDIGLTTGFSQLVVIVGHGSSSLNNPHESAHDCGACGGGRGGPNARAFAQMANDPRVRRALGQRGLLIPEATYFLGSYHNTCNDEITYYDTELLPLSHRELMNEAKTRLDSAREMDAHERCRRFESAPLGLSPRGALRHVEARAEDLAQVRPEYGHATNAICVVGRRQRTRGLYLDRRSFLASYDPTQDDDQASILTRILQAVVPVCGGINLEYYFSFVDPKGYGCATKLPHNITSLLGVMDGAASDLRTGLPWQMVEIHEPVRLQFVIETHPQIMQRIIELNPGIASLCKGDWVQLATLDPNSGDVHRYSRGEFIPHRLDQHVLPQAKSSADWYDGWREHLTFAQIGCGDSMGTHGASVKGTST
ncbi:MAG: DUF2309 domain-containing protein [Pirellulaceae bacterium]